MRALLAGGGTAGHVNPLLATAGELQRRDPSAQLAVLGTAAGLESRLVPAAGLDLITIPKARLPRRPSAEWFSLPGGLAKAVRGARHAIEQIDAEVVVGFGGYVAMPAYLAARRAGVPIVVHEANFRPGLANRFGARHAAVVAVALPGTPLPRARLTGLPLRPAIATLDRAAQRRPAAEALGLDPERPILVATGGSLGARRINQTVLATAPQLLADGVQILHLTGADKAGEVRDGIVHGGYVVREYLDDMALAYAAGDLLVARAGAGTVCEIAAVGVASVLVPLPIGNGEQALNARGLVEVGGAIAVPDAQFTPEWAAGHLPGLFADPTRLPTMASLASKVGIRDGAARLADSIAEAIG
ncbi:MAG: UDP-N-acetylglucosamine--N-acetylmuramyl-(pentapeptide) pyrophosphoryl-undecaprenol N-acetylglucosamine transferase [Bifidobacteriaceae bacterium]|jgi:undecaprenyldiphospho-muramoylpentapeptide beta-N-acetylglucosaminyltransferase|nr:UDP-N-acetylglucosamine--N-acetylmuramyl-(pentapeptide) pyrophosphoryl-undecaprenol N-acetylglucosamine transferase [Bifidobacteriaceae bacterium]